MDRSDCGGETYEVRHNSGMDSKRIVLSTFGSFGDIHPYVAIALELKARGHLPMIATSEVYREKMEAQEIAFHPVRPDLPSYDQPDELVRMLEGLMDPRQGSERVMQLVLPHLRDIYDDLSAAVADAALLLTHPLPLVGPLVAQKRKLPWVSSVLAPISFFSAYDPVPPQLPALHSLLKLGPAIARAVMRLATTRLDRLMEPVYRLRSELGLPRGEQPFWRTTLTHESAGTVL